MGDFNWVSPHFLAFASPQTSHIAPIPVTSPEYADLPTCIPEIFAANLSSPLENVLAHFVARDIGLVVRLNSPLYCPSYFTALGVAHVDMIFEDGTCPPLPLVRKFIKLAQDMIDRKRGIAVHCKAGLGRTGCLIGAYLIYRYGFTANEVIAFMRFMRPGMVVGPQQHWLHLNQGQFREWYLEKQIKARLEATKPSTPRKSSMKTMAAAGGIFTNGQTATPPNGSQVGSAMRQASRSASRSALGEISSNDVSNPTSSTAGRQEENLPAPTPGQPRKYARMDNRHHSYAQSTSAGFTLAEEDNTMDMNKTDDTQHSPLRKKLRSPETASMVSIKKTRRTLTDEAREATDPLARSQPPGEVESEEEVALRMLKQRRTPSRTTATSPSAKMGGGGGGGRRRAGSRSAGSAKPRSVSYNTTATTLSRSAMLTTARSDDVVVTTGSATSNFVDSTTSTNGFDGAECNGPDRIWEDNFDSSLVNDNDEMKNSISQLPASPSPTTIAAQKIRTPSGHVKSRSAGIRGVADNASIQQTRSAAATTSTPSRRRSGGEERCRVRKSSARGAGATAISSAVAVAAGGGNGSAGAVAG